MDMLAMINSLGPLWSPGVFATLVALAVWLGWMALRPATPRQDVRGRLDDYLERNDIVLEEVMEGSFASRALLPILRTTLRTLGRVLPSRNIESTRVQIQAAGNPGNLSPMDFYGVRVLAMLVLGGVVFLGFSHGQPLLLALRNAAGGLALGYVLPGMWLKGKAKKRRAEVLRALPDALDMLTIGVEAGLAFESAMLRVGEKWTNVLTVEFNRAVTEMRVGMTREEALRRMAERCRVSELTTFVAVLVQSSQLGVSISQVLHAQADDMRMRRRQHAEELARQAGIKMIFPLALLILPSLFVVILGPSIPTFMSMFRAMSGATGGIP